MTAYDADNNWPTAMLDDRGPLYGLGRPCRVCGCTDGRACPGGCDWAEPGLCTACVEERPQRLRWPPFVLGLVIGLLAGFWLAIGVFAIFVWRAGHLG